MRSVRPGPRPPADGAPVASPRRFSLHLRGWAGGRLGIGPGGALSRLAARAHVSGRSSGLVLALLLAFLSAACSSEVTPSTPPSARPSPTASLALESPPAASGGPSVCPIEPTSGRLASNRLLDVVVDPGGTWVRFRFGPGTGLPGEGRLEEAHPPFDRTPSGLPVEVLGERVVRLHFEALVLFDELGNPTYGGPDRIRPLGGPIRDVVVEEAFEGVMNWLVGFDGPACLRLRQGVDPLVLQLVVAPTE